MTRPSATGLAWPPRLAAPLLGLTLLAVAGTPRRLWPFPELLFVWGPGLAAAAGAWPILNASTGVLELSVTCAEAPAAPCRLCLVLAPRSFNALEAWVEMSGTESLPEFVLMQGASSSSFAPSACGAADDMGR